jgi:hypothetical protein
MIRRPIVISLSITLLFSSCFIGADTYERSVNDNFFLYSNTSKSDNVCLGTIDANAYRFADNYLCSIKKVGWDKSFLIVKTNNEQYYIQHLNKLDGLYPEEFVRYLFGPLNESDYNRYRDSLRVDTDLDFKISY